MKLNHDCIRSILLEIEKKPCFDEDLQIVTTDVSDIFTSLDKYSDQEILYCLQRMIEAEIIIATLNFASGAFVSGSITAITSKGHEYLESIRNHKVWQKVKEKLTKAGSMSFELIMSAALEVLKSNIGI